MSPADRQGIVIRYQSGFYSVKTDDEIIVCRLRGRLKRGPLKGDIVTIGDNVRIAIQSDGTGAIEEVEERKSALIRMAPTPRGVYQQVLIANPDQIIIIFACADPDPNTRMLDRFLVICEKQELEPIIVLNKFDLVRRRSAKREFSVYQSLGYTVLYTSAESGTGIKKLNKILEGKISCFTGPSGVGKTSILNKLKPELGLNVREISQSTSKGKHTTVVRELFPIGSSGYVADLPGIRALALWDIEPEEIDGYFPEIRSLVSKCHFSDCSHQNEPDCAVLTALENGKIDPGRYESYLRMRWGEEQRIESEIN